jgi:hypothetical protein
VPGPANQAVRASIRFGSGGNDAGLLADGWSGDESGFRWAVGASSALRLPPLPAAPGANLLLAVKLISLELAGRPRQRVRLLVNGAEAGELALRAGHGEYARLIDAGAFHPDAENVLRFEFLYRAQPRENHPSDTRELAVAFRSLEIREAGFRLFPQARVLPPVDAAALSAQRKAAIFERFQSLGQNCEFGLVQRHAGVERLGLYRFASARLMDVTEGIRLRFAGIDKAEHLRIQSNASGDDFECVQSRYGIEYHAFLVPGQRDIEAFRAREPARLRFLADLLLQDIARARKVFVLQRGESPLSCEEVLPLFLELRAFNPANRLLFVTASGDGGPSVRGPVQNLAPGLYRGTIPAFAPAENAYDFDYGAWTALCATLLADLDRQAHGLPAEGAAP